MSAARAAYFMGLMICLPLFIHTWGVVYDSSQPIHAVRAVEDAIELLWLLQGTMQLISAPWFIRAFSIKTSLMAHLMLVMAPLPFIALAWLADAASNIALLKFLGSLLLLSSLTVMLVLPFNRFRAFDRLPIKLDMPVCLIAAIGLWKTGDLWLSWLM